MLNTSCFGGTPLLTTSVTKVSDLTMLADMANRLIVTGQFQDVKIYDVSSLDEFSRTEGKSVAIIHDTGSTSQDSVFPDREFHIMRFHVIVKLSAKDDPSGVGELDRLLGYIHTAIDDAAIGNKCLREHTKIKYARISTSKRPVYQLWVTGELGFMITSTQEYGGP